MKTESVFIASVPFREFLVLSDALHLPPAIGQHLHDVIATDLTDHPGFLPNFFPKNPGSGLIVC